MSEGNDKRRDTGKQRPPPETVHGTDGEVLKNRKGPPPPVNVTDTVRPPPPPNKPKQ